MPESGRTIRDVRGPRPCSCAMDGCWRWARPPSCGSEQGERCASSMPGDAWSCLRSPVAASLKETRRTSCSSTIWSRWYLSQSSTNDRSCSSCPPAGLCVIGAPRAVETAPATREPCRTAWMRASKRRRLKRSPAPLTVDDPAACGRDRREPSDIVANTNKMIGHHRAANATAIPLRKGPSKDRMCGGSHLRICSPRLGQLIYERLA